MASKTVANDNRIAEIGDCVSGKERRLLDIYNSLSPANKALLLQRVEQIVPLPGERTR